MTRIATFGLLALLAAIGSLGMASPEPKVRFEIQLTAPAGLPLDGWTFGVVPEGTTREAAQLVTSSATGLLAFEIPSSHFPPPPAAQAVSFFGARDGKGGTPRRKFTECFLDRDRLGRVAGPFAAGDTVQRTLALTAGAVATGTINAPGSAADGGVKIAVRNPDNAGSMTSFILSSGPQRVEGLPREAGVPLIVRSWSSFRLVSVDLSSGVGDWGVVDVPAPTGSSKLRLRLTEVPAALQSATATIVSRTTGICYVAYNFNKLEILQGRPEDASGISLPPGEYLIFVGSLVGTESITALSRLRDGPPFEATKIPHVTLVDGQTTDVQLNYAEWYPKRLEVLPASEDRGRLERIAETIGSIPKFHYPPGFKDPNAAIPAPPPPSKP